MKNLKKLHVAFCAGLLIFTSACDKRDDIAQTTLLTRMTASRTDGTDYNCTFEYDMHNRLTKIKESYDSTTHEAQITYNADRKMDQYLTIQNGIETSKSVYTWTDTSVTAMNWVINENNVWVKGNYKGIYDLDSNGLIIKNQWFYKQDTIWIGLNYSLFTWTNGNVEKIDTWSTDIKKSSPLKHLNNENSMFINVAGLKAVNDTKYLTTTYEYDNKINAYSGLGFAYDIDGFNKNNVIKVTYSYDNHEDIIYNIRFEYNDKNYPIKRITSNTNPENGEVSSSILLYEYTTK